MKKIGLSVMLSTLLLSSSCFASDVNSSSASASSSINETAKQVQVDEQSELKKNFFEVFKKDGVVLVKSINNIVDVKEIAGLKAIFVTMIDGNEEMFYTNAKGTLVLQGSLFITKNLQPNLPIELQPYVLELQQKKENFEKTSKDESIKKAKEIYNTTLDKKSIIALGNDKNKKTIIMIVDTECPHCANSISDLPKTLKDYNVELIIPSIYGDSSIKKAALIYQNLPKVKTDSEKIELLKKYFNKENTSELLKTQPKKEFVDMVNTNIDLFVKSYVVRAVPFIFEK